MLEEEYQLQFNQTLGRILTLIEVSGNEALKKKVRSELFDFSDFIKERVIKGERENGLDKNKD